MSDIKPRIAVFIDAGNVWASYKQLKKVLDFSTFASFFSEKFGGDIFRIFYYRAYPRDGARDKKSIEDIHKFFTYLKKELKFSIIKKPLKTIFIKDSDGNVIFDPKTGKPKHTEKGNFDVELTIDSLKYSSAYDIAIFLTGDSDFLPLVSYLKNLKQSKKVFVFSTKGCISSELISGSDKYYDLANCPEIHGNDLRYKQNIK